MQNISKTELDIIRHLHLGGKGIHVVAHCPQQKGGCHPFEFLRGVLPNETYEDAYNRVKPDILQYIANECGKSCDCNNGTPEISYYPFS